VFNFVFLLLAPHRSTLPAAQVLGYSSIIRYLYMILTQVLGYGGLVTGDAVEEPHSTHISAYVRTFAFNLAYIYRSIGCPSLLSISSKFKQKAIHQLHVSAAGNTAKCGARGCLFLFFSSQKKHVRTYHINARTASRRRHEIEFLA
jgi:hypothetical protein